MPLCLGELITLEAIMLCPQMGVGLKLLKCKKRVFFFFFNRMANWSKNPAWVAHLTLTYKLMYHLISTNYSQEVMD